MVEALRKMVFVAMLVALAVAAVAGDMLGTRIDMPRWLVEVLDQHQR